MADPTQGGGQGVGRPEGEPSGTLRQQLAEELRRGSRTTLDLSKALGIREREVGDHLAHLERSVRRRGERLRTEPSRCLGCGFTFAGRRRFSRPGHCPRCRGDRITRPRFTLERR